MKKLTISVGIPAYNEERTIGRALDSLLSQNKKLYTLQSIRVFSDGSSDNTGGIANKYHKKVEVKNFRKNLGKLARVNQLLKENTADVLVLMDADIIIESRSTLDNLIKPFLHSNPGVVFANHKAKSPSSFVGKISYFGYSVWDRAKTKLGSKGIRYYAEGGMVAFSKDFAEVYRLPTTLSTGDDSYLFYKAISLGYVVKVAKSACVYLDLAEGLNDYIRQMKRFLKDSHIIEHQFDEELINKYETMTTILKTKILCKEIVKKPFIGLSYVILQGYTKFLVPFANDANGWKPIERKAHD